MMHRIKCPWCGVRDEDEFQYQGDATVRRPDENMPEQKFFEYVYVRDNPKGWHTEWWQHTGGCRQWIKVMRNTLTHQIHKTVMHNQTIKPPKEK